MLPFTCGKPPALLLTAGRPAMKPVRPGQIAPGSESCLLIKSPGDFHLFSHPGNCGKPVFPVHERFHQQRSWSEISTDVADIPHFQNLRHCHVRGNVSDIVLENREIAGIRVTALPAVHTVKENCYLFQRGEKSVFFGGDTQLFPGMSEIGNRFDIKVALLPISGMRFFQGRFGLIKRICMNPFDAAEAALRLKTRMVIPIHYHITCSIPLYDQFITPGSPQKFVEQMRRKAPQVQVAVLDTGEVWEG